MAGMDWRNLRTGREIPTENYSDQPYVVKADDGAWVCVLTTGAGHEGQNGQHVVTLRSLDRGRTWEPPVDVEPATGPEASYAVLLKIPGGRLCCFYNHNTDNLRQVEADNPPYRDGYCRRVDSLGYFVYKYSDDHGQSWSDRRYPIPVREMDIDRCNPYGGAIRFLWNVGRPFIHAGAAYVSLHKVGGFGAGFFTRSEGVLLRSASLLCETDPGNVTWETLPEGDFGLRTPPGGGPIAEEQSYVVLSDGSFYAVYRSVDGHPVCSYSRDQGRTWTVPTYKSYADGRLMKHPRAANFVWKCGNGHFLYWFHNHGGKGYEDRNPVWLSAGREQASPAGRVIAWSQPEIVLYDDDPFVRMSYPDLVEEDGEFFFTETQKDMARVHPVPAGFLELLWSQFDRCEVTRDGLLAEWSRPSGSVEFPILPEFVARDHSRPDYGTKRLGQGFSLELEFSAQSPAPGRTLLDTRTETGQGLAVTTTDRTSIRIVLNDGRSESAWDCDPGSLRTGRLQHVVITVDGGPGIITFVVDGALCDGGRSRQFGWGRFSPNLRSANGAGELRIAPAFAGEIRTLRVYGRALTTTEAIGNGRACSRGQ